MERLQADVARLQSLSRNTLPLGTPVDRLASDARSWFGTLGHGMEREILRHDDAFESGLVSTLSSVKSDQMLDCAAAVRRTLLSRMKCWVSASWQRLQHLWIGAKVLKSGWKTGISEGRIQSVTGNDVAIERLPGLCLSQTPYLLNRLRLPVDSE